MNYPKHRNSKRERTPELINNIQEDYKNGLTIVKIREKYNVGTNFVTETCRNIQREVKTVRKRNKGAGRRKKKFSEETILEIKTLNVLGVSKKKLCEKYDICYMTLMSIINSPGESVILW